jgi:hypothetical protein
VLKSELGLQDTISIGDPVHAAPEGLRPIDGVVDYLSQDFLGIRTADTLYRFQHDSAFTNTMVAGLHDFSQPPDPRVTAGAWEAWFARAFA